jgi:hypothetical protein
MTKSRVRRIYRTLTPAEKRRVKRVRERVGKELPDLLRRNQQAHDAMKEKTFSGSLRRAIQRSNFLLPDLARRAEIATRDIADFLAGEKTLPSDVIDRLVKILKLTLPTSKPRGTAKAS